MQKLTIEPKEREIFFSQDVKRESIRDLTKQILAIEESDKKLKKTCKRNGFEYKPKPIKLYIDSPGGAVYPCLGLLSVMERCKTPIHTIATGMAMSCGFMILISGHKRFASKYSTLMYHQISSFAWGEIKGIQESLEEGQRLQKIIEKITLDSTKITPERIKEVFEKKIDWFMDSKEALKLGVIDEII